MTKRLRRAVVTISEWLWGCSHKKLSRPMTLEHPIRKKRGQRGKHAHKGKRTLVTCLECGGQWEYSLRDMRVEWHKKAEEEQ